MELLLKLAAVLVALFVIRGFGLIGLGVVVGCLALWSRKIKSP